MAAQYPGLEIIRLKQQNDALRRRVAELEEALDLTAPVPPAFRAGPATARRRTWNLLAALVAHGSLTADTASAVIWGDRPPSKRPGKPALMAYVMRVRAFLSRHGIMVATRSRVGWWLPEEQWTRAQKLVDELRTREAA
jgi:hypothetical protein